MANPARSRRCALCQRFYGSGFLDNVPAGELLRARRMLMERSTEDDEPTSRLIREGFDQFLADLTREREALDISQRHMPLDVCVFCVQLLPSSYNLSGDTEDQQRAQTPTNYTVRAAPPSSRVVDRCSSEGQMRSSLVIQHQFPRKTATPSSLGKSPRTMRMVARIHRPRSYSRPAPSVPESPRTSPTYRLLSNDATRVLRIESPTAALDSMGDQHRRLLTATDDVMGNLRVQEKQQGAAILRAESSKREAHYRQRTSTAKLAQQHARERAECMVSGSVDTGSPQHQNIIGALIRGAGTLYTGVVVAQLENNPPIPAPRTSVAAKGSKIVTKKHGRHFKTELYFPAIPASARTTRKG
ncbi:hypothetical protein PHYPSEUDO_007548 [Phytophthora pseudosyringae]|uniref:Uncharacterized protein n=1 Tax=Phytophthora pseudosyringae TaxID=221518 RepID=A0A8T1VJF0_9STRA|nr:hypothetical protein PHYPSEUDO_007548 [Phytophthora pseudosyringae]